MTFLTEDDLEGVIAAQLETLGYTHLAADIAGPEGRRPERGSHGEVVLGERLRAGLEQLNPTMPLTAREEAFRMLTSQGLPHLVEENRRVHKLITEGVSVEYYREDGTLRGDQAKVIDFENVERNDFCVLSQFTVIENGHNRRPDLVVFVNGLPLAVIELKAPGSEEANVTTAFGQLQTYKAQIPSLFHYNGVCVTGDGPQARIGSLTANLERFMPWRTIDGDLIADRGEAEMSVLIAGVFEPTRFLELVKNFTVFGTSADGDTIKIVAGYHQFHGAKKAVAATLRALPSPAQSEAAEAPEAFGLPSQAQQEKGDKRIGVVWHTQGSGKSLLMAFYAGQLVTHEALANPTLVVVTDRNDLDDQLYGTFAMCRDLIRQTPEQADTRQHLQDLLTRESGGVIFTTMQKFAPETGSYELPELSDRRNIIVIADEAHRSQYGFKTTLDRKTGEYRYGYAKHLRDALPNASFIGFSGTPIESDDKSTPDVFGHYIDVYDITRAVEDQATVPIYYESRLARIELPEDLKPQIDAEIETLTEGEETSEAEQKKQKWAAQEALVGSDARLDIIANDLIGHWERREAALDGKAMIVCMSRRICVALYNKLIERRPEWHSDNEDEGVVKVVMSGAASDPPEWQPHIRNTKKAKDDIAARAKKANDPLKLVIVRDMWLTGFDAPSLHTMYVDKPMRGHNLMQAIARVNRVFKDKPAGLIVDYIGIGQNLKRALGDYTERDRDKTGIDQSQAIEALKRTLGIVRDMFHGFNYHQALNAHPAERLKVLAAAMDFVLSKQEEAAGRAASDEEQKNAHRRYNDNVLALSKAFALASSTDYAASVVKEVGFFQTIRAALAKTRIHGVGNPAAVGLAVQQLIDGALVSTEIVDILSAAGLESPDISILSDEFLDDLKGMKTKNLALEALKKLLADEIKSRSKTNVVESRKFSERLTDAVNRYHLNALSTVEVLQELIDLAKEIQHTIARGQEYGFTDDERAFYDALAQNHSAVEVMGDENLRVIALELLDSLKSNVSVDWTRRESARARLRVIIKRILRRHGYPPDLQSEAVQTVIQQAEVLAPLWSDQ